LVNEAIVNDTVKRMIDAGIDQPTIIATLKDIGLSDVDANAVIQKMTAPPAPITPPEADDTKNEVREMKEQMVVQGERQEATEEALHSKLGEHEEKLGSVEQKVNEVNENVKKMPLNGNGSPANQKMITELNVKLDEVSATSKATRDLMQQILEINRKILTELESKK
jgi:hypothetical protein